MNEEGVNWFKRADEFLVDGTPLYGTNNYYTVRMVYGGHFEDNDKNLYTGSGVGWFDYVIPEKTKLCDLLDMASKLELDDGEKIQLWQKIYIMDQHVGFKSIKNDQDVLEIPKYIFQRDEREAEIYVEIEVKVGSVSDNLQLSKKAKIQCTGKGKEKMDCDVLEDNMSDNSSSYESFNDSQYDSAKDDLYYDDNVDVGVEYAGISEGAKQKGEARLSSKPVESVPSPIGKKVAMDDSDYDTDDGLDGYKSGDDCVRPNGRRFDPRIDMEDPKFEILMQFKDSKQFRAAVKRHAIKKEKPITFLFQTGDKVKAVCKHPCEWSCYASRDQHERQLVIKTLNSNHSCGRCFKSKFTDSSWIAKEFIDELKENPNINAKVIKGKIWKEYTLNVSTHQVYRGKEKALKMLNGSANVQYGLLWDYAEELRRRNPGSTVTMKLVDGSMEIGRPKFERFYVCLGGLKSGFKHCRRILSVDGCFLKGEYGGQLLSASGIDPNNNWYPVAYAVVESECKDSWSWFMVQLIEDLEINDMGFTIMSDKQKGLIETIKDLLPNAEHRFCVMHMLGNMRNAGFKGITYKNLLWNEARATTVHRFKHWMEQMAEHDINAFHWFDDKPPEHWSRSAFDTTVKCDILLNNLSESFNSYILDARDKPILSCLESIRRMLMVRLAENNI